jgi:HD-like signal output (HDOD) protein
MKLDRETIVSLGSRLPPSLGVLGRLQALLQDARSDLDDIVELVNIDPALTFQVIKLANSALYGARSRCESLDEAVARVGFRDIHQIVGLAVSRHAFQGELPVYDLAGGRLWENAVAIGTLNAELATLAGGDARAAYATGLLRSIGKVVLNNFAPQLRYPGEAVAPLACEWEQAEFGVTSAATSAVLLEHWRFAPETIAAVRGHRVPGQEPAFAAAAARLHLACGMAVVRSCALPGEGSGWNVEPAMFRLAGVPEGEIPGAVERAHRRFVECAMLEWSHSAA